jgi:hypothetical protein
MQKEEFQLFKQFMKKILICSLLITLVFSCKKKENTEEEKSTTSTSTTGGNNNNCPTCDFPDTAWNVAGSGAKLIFKFKFDSTQARLNNLGNPSGVAPGNAGQSPRFNGMSAHYIELSKSDSVPVGQGVVLYRAEETTCGGANAITFCKSVVCKEGDVCFSVPISSVTPGTYKWLRVSLAYQNYDIKVRANSQNVDGTVASFVGFNTYVTKFKMKNAVMTPSVSPGAGNHPQGYWAFYTKVQGYEFKSDGQAAGTTVVNPISSTSPIPANSCLVTGRFFKESQNQNLPLQITGNETNDIIITISLSTNKSFEWKEMTSDGLWEPSIGETVVDMGLRGLMAKY